MVKLVHPGDRAADPLLEALFEARDRERRDAVIGSLVHDHAGSVIRKNLRFRLPTATMDEIDELRASIVLRLVRRLQEIEPGGAESIGRFDDYVAIITHHAVDDFLRRKFPERALFKNRLRYLLGHDSRFAVWNKQRRLLAGLEAWEGMDAEPLANVPGVLLNPRKLAASLLLLFEAVGKPIELDALVSLFAIDESRPVAVEPRETAPSALEQLSNKQTLAALWSEVEQLPPRQRTALLLHFRDENGQSALPLIPQTGTATLPRIAELLGIETEELQALWNDLPLDDNRIAGLLNASRQQVINLRKCARERLARRTRR